MPILLAFEFAPATIALWIAVGLISGWLAGFFMGAASYGSIGDLILGVFGALAGGFLFGFWGSEFWISIVIAFAGACIFIAVARTVMALRRA